MTEKTEQSTDETSAAGDISAIHRWPKDYPKTSARLANILKQTRSERGLSLMRLSRVSTVSRRTIREMERGDGSLPNLGTLVKVTRVLGLSFAEIAEHIDAGE